MKEQVIKAIKYANIEENGWIDDILDSIHEDYNFARGYLSAKVGELYESLSSADEDFRYYLLDFCERDIWDK